MVGPNVSDFDNCMVLNSLLSSYRCRTIIKTWGGLTKLSFKAGSIIEDDVKIRKCMNFVCSKCHISVSLKDIQEEYKFPPELIKGEIDQDLIINGIYKDYNNLWRPYLIDDVLVLAYVLARHGKNIHKMTGVS